MQLIERLNNIYGVDAPIMTEEIMSEWSEYSRPRVFQLLTAYTKRGLLKKYDTGIYFIPTQSILGESTLNRRKVIEKRFIKSGNDIYGYYAGLTLLNGLRLTTQMPNKLEIVSSKESSNVRDVNIGSSTIRVRKSRMPIDKDNVYALMLLEAFNEIKRPLIDDELCGVREFVKERSIKQNDVYRYANVFPAKAIKNLIGTGVENVFA